MNLFRGLYKFDQSNNLVPAMAEGYTLSEDEDDLHLHPAGWLSLVRRLAPHRLRFRIHL